MITLSSSQVVLQQVLTDPFAMGENVEKFCFNATQWLATQQQFQQTAMNFGYFCLIIGGIIGALSGYYYAKERYGRSQ